VWKDVAFHTLGGGIVGALLAAVPGFIDFFSITDVRAGRVALTHMATNLITLAIFVVSFLLRWIDVAGFLAAGLRIVAVGAMAVAGWYGGELVFVQGMGVKPPRKSSSERVEPASSHRLIRRLGTRLGPRAAEAPPGETVALSHVEPEIAA